MYCNYHESKVNIGKKRSGMVNHFNRQCMARSRTHLSVHAHVIIELLELETVTHLGDELSSNDKALVAVNRTLRS